MKKIYIDPGHGGKDPGAQGHGLVEKDLTLAISHHIMDYLNKLYEGHEIKMSRIHDTYPTLDDRTNEANNWGADVFLSVHINAGGGSGFESYIYPGHYPDTQRMQDVIHPTLANGVYIDFSDRGQKTANFHVLRESSMNAILTENLFIDTRQDAEFLMDEDNLREIALGHAHGLANFLGLERKEEVHHSGKGLYHVQVGAFAHKENATQLAQELQEKGYPTYITKY